MVCADVGSTNPDIAGLGIVISFMIQAGLSFFLSGWSIVIETRLRRREIIRIKSRTHNGQNGEQQTQKNPPSIADMLWNSPDTTPETNDGKFSNAKIILIDRVLRRIGDTQLLNGISLLVGALAQHQTLSLYHFHIVYDVVNFTGVSAAAAVTTTFKQPGGFYFRGLSITLYMFLYLVFIALFGLKLQTWDDGVSGLCYDSSRISASGAAHPYVDNIYLSVTALYLFAALTYTRFVSPGKLKVLLRDLKNKAEQRQSSDTLWQAFVDGLLTGLTSGQWMKKKIKWIPKTFGLAGRRSRNASRHTGSAVSRVVGGHLDFLFKAYSNNWSPYGTRAIVLGLSLYQYPVHGYMVFALRASNEKYLTGSSENEWGFGQIVALLVLLPVLLECMKATAGKSTPSRLIRSRTDEKTEYMVSREPDRIRTPGVGKNRACSTFFRALLLDEDSAGPLLPTNRSQRSGRRQSSKSDERELHHLVPPINRTTVPDRRPSLYHDEHKIPGAPDPTNWPGRPERRLSLP